MFFDQLKRICEARGLKVTTTVKAAGLSTGLIGNWKNGGKPTYDTLCRLADYLGVSVQEFVEDEPREARAQEHNELTEYLDQLRERPEMRMLFSVAKNATKEETVNTNLRRRHSRRQLGLRPLFARRRI